MALGLAVIFGIVGLVVAAKIGFFETCAVFLNALVAIYVALFLTPTVLGLAPDLAALPCGVALTALVLSVGTFAALYAACFFLITGQFKVPFPAMFDTLVAGGLGFMLGFLVFSFLLVIAAGAPVPYVSDFIDDDAIAGNTKAVCWWCDRVHRYVGTDDRPQPTQEAITLLTALGHPNEPLAPPPPDGDPNTVAPPTPPQESAARHIYLGHTEI